MLSTLIHTSRIKAIYFIFRYNVQIMYNKTGTKSLRIPRYN